MAVPNTCATFEITGEASVTKRVRGLNLGLPDHFRDRWLVAVTRPLTATDLVKPYVDRCRSKFHGQGFRFSFSESSGPKVAVGHAPSVTSTVLIFLKRTKKFYSFTCPYENIVASNQPNKTWDAEWARRRLLRLLTIDCPNVVSDVNFRLERGKPGDRWLIYRGTYKSSADVLPQQFR